MLPLEVLEQILLANDFFDIISFCSTCREFRTLLCNKFFWQGIFRKENLTLLETGNDVTEWILIYKNSLVCKCFVQAMITSIHRYTSGDIYNIWGNITPIELFMLDDKILSKISNLDIFQVDPVDLSCLKLCLSKNRQQKLRHFINNQINTFAGRASIYHDELTKHITNVQKTKISRVDVKIILHKHKIFYRVYFEEVVVYSIEISYENVHTLLYKLAYYGLLNEIRGYKACFY